MRYVIYIGNMIWDSTQSLKEAEEMFEKAKSSCKIDSVALVKECQEVIQIEFVE